MSNQRKGREYCLQPGLLDGENRDRKTMVSSREGWIYLRGGMVRNS